jgi:hypothetical protein
MINRSVIYIKLLFAAVILWQPVQYALVPRFGEAYPLLQLPQFSGTMNDADGNIRLDTVAVEVLFADNSTTRFSQHVLLSPVPSAFHDSIMKHMFGPVSGRAVTPVNGRWQRTKAFLFPGLLAARARDTATEIDPDTKAWLHRRILELYPAKEPAKVSFVWQTDVYHKTGPFPVTHQPIGVREVRLAEIR